jgi:hypothetical protein
VFPPLWDCLSSGGFETSLPSKNYVSVSCFFHSSEFPVNNNNNNNNIRPMMTMMMKKKKLTEDDVICCVSHIQSVLYPRCERLRWVGQRLVGATDRPRPA